MSDLCKYTKYTHCVYNYQKAIDEIRIAYYNVNIKKKGWLL